VTKPPAPALAIAQITSILKKPTRKSLLKPAEKMRSTWLRSNYFVSERMPHEAMNAIAWHGAGTKMVKPILLFDRFASKQLKPLGRAPAIPR